MEEITHYTIGEKEYCFYGNWDDTPHPGGVFPIQHLYDVLKMEYQFSGPIHASRAIRFANQCGIETERAIMIIRNLLQSGDFFEPKKDMIGVS